MTAQATIICIGCPVGCRIQLTANNQGGIIGMADYQCEIGKKYAQDEFKDPVRTLTTTVVTAGSSTQILLPVRTNKPINREQIKECMKFLCNLTVEPPIRVGQVITANVLNTGADVVSCAELLNGG